MAFCGRGYRLHLAVAALLAGLVSLYILSKDMFHSVIYKKSIEDIQILNHYFPVGQTVRDYTDPAALTDQFRKILSKDAESGDSNGVIAQFIQNLKVRGELDSNVHMSRMPMLAKERLRRKDTELSLEDLKSIQRCMDTAGKDRDRDFHRFFGNRGKTQEIRRLHHNYLNKDSLMIEVGGNWGYDSGNFTKLYNPMYVILEPLDDYVQMLKKKFVSNTNVKIYKLGLGSKNETIKVTLEGNNACATSKFSEKSGNVSIYIMEATSFMTYLGVGAFDVDLLTMNCEGCEYEALENLLTSNIIERFKNIQWATHTKLTGLKEPYFRYCRIQALLSRTHRPTYQYKFNWESWRRKDLP